MRLRTLWFAIIVMIIMWISLVSLGLLLGTAGSAIVLQATHQPTADFDGHAFHFTAWRGADIHARINAGTQALYGRWAAPGGVHLTLTSIEAGSSLDIVVCKSSEADWGDSIVSGGFSHNEDLTMVCDFKMPSNISGPETQHFTGQLSGQIIFPLQDPSGSLTFDNFTKQLTFSADLRLGPDPMTALYSNEGGILGGISLIPGFISLVFWFFAVMGSAHNWVTTWWSRRRAARQAPTAQKTMSLNKPPGDFLWGLVKTLYGLCFLTMFALAVLISTNVVQGPTWLEVVGVAAGGYLVAIAVLQLVRAGKNVRKAS